MVLEWVNSFFKDFNNLFNYEKRLISQRGFHITDIGLLFAGTIILIIYYAMYGPLTDILFPLLDNDTHNEYGVVVKLIVQLFPLALAGLFIIVPFLGKNDYRQM